MHGIPTIDDPRSKGRYRCYVLRTQSFQGFTYGPGKRILAIKNSQNQNCLQFMCCKNYAKGGAGLIAAISSVAFDRLPIDEYFDAQFALIQGVVDCGGIPKVVYHKWIGPSRNETRNMSALVSEFISPIDFAKIYFDAKPLYLPLESCHIDFLNQFSGATIQGWRTNIRVSEEEKFDCFQSDLVPDAWLKNPLSGKRSTLNLLTMPSLTKTKGIVLEDEVKDPAAKFCGLPPLQLFSESRTRVLFVHRLSAVGSVPVTSLLPYFFMPLPFKTQEGNLLFAPITKQQASDLDTLFPTPTSKMSTKTFNRLLLNNIQTNGFEDYVEMYPFSVTSSHQQTVVSVVPSNSKLIGKRLNSSMYEAILPRNHRDYDIDGFSVFRGYQWVYQRVLSPILQIFLGIVYFGSGLQRYCTEHLGRFFMVGLRQSTMSSASMGQAPAQAHLHFYSNHKQQCTALLPLAQPFINSLAQQAMKTQIHGGDVMQNLLRKAIEVKENWKISVDVICPYKILTFFFSNTGHMDNDCMTAEDSKLVEDYVDESPRHTLKEYLLRFKSVFSEHSTKLPLPTTCCWLPMDESNDEWYHMQYFILLDFGLAYDLSSDVFMDDVDQIGATFYGSVFNHLTSRSLWVSRDRKFVTLHPSGRNGLFAWGRGGGSSNLKAATKNRRSKRIANQDKSVKRSKN